MAAFLYEDLTAVCPAPGRSVAVDCRVFSGGLVEGDHDAFVLSIVLGIEDVARPGAVLGSPARPLFVVDVAAADFPFCGDEIFLLGDPVHVDAAPARDLGVDDLDAVVELAD